MELYKSVDGLDVDVNEHFIKVIVDLRDEVMHHNPRTHGFLLVAFTVEVLNEAVFISHFDILDLLLGSLIMLHHPVGCPVSVLLRRLRCLLLHRWLDELLVGIQHLLEHISIENTGIVVVDSCGNHI